MGSRNPEREWPVVTFQSALTLADIKRLGWRVRASCPKCKTVLAVDINQRIKALGEFAILWGRRARCPAIRGFDGEACGGQMVFEMSGHRTQPFMPMTKLPDADFLRWVGRRAYDGNSDVVIW